MALSDPATQTTAASAADVHSLGDVDAWHLRRRGEWLVFQARLDGAQGIRDFCRLVDPGGMEAEAHIIADTPGPLFGILSIGGARGAHALPERPAFPYHILAPGDDIGAVGMAGTGPADSVSHLHHLREVTRDAVLAEALLRERWDNHRALPLYMVRAETDASASVAALAEGMALANLLRAAESLAAAAERLGKVARILCLRIDYSLEDVISSSNAYRDGLLTLLDKLTEGLAARGFRKPVFLASFDCGTPDVSEGPALQAQSELVWNHAQHDLVFAAPGYCFAQNGYGRPTARAMRQMTEMERLALNAVYDEQEWFCPMLLLAEREGDKVIRVRARAMADLVIDPADPFDAGPACGFAVEDDRGPAHILSVAVDVADPQDILLTLDRAIGPGGRLRYAIGAPPRVPGARAAEYPAARGALREVQPVSSLDGEALYRWALPCLLEIH